MSKEGVEENVTGSLCVTENISDGVTRSLYINSGVIFFLVVVFGGAYYYTESQVWVHIMVFLGFAGLLYQPLAARKAKKSIRSIILKTYGQPIRDMKMMKVLVPKGRYVVNHVYHDKEKGIGLALWGFTSKCPSHIQVKDGLVDESSVSPQIGMSIRLLYIDDGSYIRVHFQETEMLAIPEMEKAIKGDYTRLEENAPSEVAPATIQ